VLAGEVRAFSAIFSYSSHSLKNNTIIITMYQMYNVTSPNHFANTCQVTSSTCGAINSGFKLLPFVQNLVILDHSLQQFPSQTISSLCQTTNQLITMELEHPNLDDLKKHSIVRVHKPISL
jgi:hypothetical protein